MPLRVHNQRRLVTFIKSSALGSMLGSSVSNSRRRGDLKEDHGRGVPSGQSLSAGIPITLASSTMHKQIYNLSHFNSHFPGGPGLANTRMSPFWISLELRVTEMVVTTGAIRRAKLQSKCHHQHPVFFTGRMPFLLPNEQCQSTDGKMHKWIHNMYCNICFLIQYSEKQQPRLKGKGSSLDIEPFTILHSGALQTQKWQLIGIDCSTVAQASGCP